MSQVTGSWQMLSQFSRTVGKKTLAITDLSVSLQGLVKLCKSLLWGVTEKHLKNNAVSHSQHAFMRGKSYSTNLISFYDKVIHLVDQRTLENVILLDFRKAFNAVSHSTLLGKMSSIQLRKEHNVMGEQLVDRPGSKGYGKSGYIKLEDNHYWGSPGLHFKDSLMFKCFHVFINDL